MKDNYILTTLLCKFGKLFYHNSYTKLVSHRFPKMSQVFESQDHDITQSPKEL